MGPTPGRAQDSAWPGAAAQSSGGAVQHSLLWGVTRWCGGGLPLTSTAEGNKLLSVLSSMPWEGDCTLGPLATVF